MNKQIIDIEPFTKEATSDLEDTIDFLENGIKNNVQLGTAKDNRSTLLSTRVFINCLRTGCNGINGVNALSALSNKYSIAIKELDEAITNYKK